MKSTRFDKFSLTFSAAVWSPQRRERAVVCSCHGAKLPASVSFGAADTEEMYGLKLLLEQSYRGRSTFGASEVGRPQCGKQCGVTVASATRRQASLVMGTEVSWTNHEDALFGCADDLSDESLQ